MTATLTWLDGKVADSHSVCQDLPRLLSNPMIHYLVREKQHTSLHNKNEQDGCFSGTSRNES